MEQINDYIEDCESQLSMHRSAGRRYTRLDQINSGIGIILTAGLSLTMTIVTALKLEDIQITIIGSVFAFAIAISSKVASIYDFRVLASKHYDASDEYNTLKFVFESLKLDTIMERLNDNEYESACKEFIRVSKWSHLDTCNGCC